MFFKRLAKAAPIAFPHAFRGQSNSTSTNFRIPFGAIAAISGGISYFYYDSPNLKGCLLNEEDGDRLWRRKKYLTSKAFSSAVCTTLNPDKWIEFKLQDKAKVSRNTQLFRFLFDPSAKLGPDVSSCHITRFPLEQDAEGKTKYVIRPYTPISDPDSKGHFDMLIKVYPDGKMNQHFASLKPSDVVEVKDFTARMTYYSKKLDLLEDSHPNLKICYTVDNPSKNWSQVQDTYRRIWL